VVLEGQDLQAQQDLQVTQDLKAFKVLLATSGHQGLKDLMDNRDQSAHQESQALTVR